MSIALMTAAFKADIPATQKLVLLALCDSANDQGECYPSVKALEGKCSLTDRAIQHCLTALQDSGYLRREFRKGRSTVYWMTPERGSPRTSFTPKDVRHTPEPYSPPPPNVVHPTPERGSPITIREPIEEEKEKARKRATPPKPDDVDEQVWQDWLQLRKGKRSAVTNTVVNEARAEAQKAGLSLNRFFSIWCARGSQGLQAEWLRADERQSGETNYQRSMRERAAEIHPAIARKAPGQINPNPMEVLDGFIKPRLLG